MLHRIALFYRTTGLAVITCLTLVPVPLLAEEGGGAALGSGFSERRPSDAQSVSHQADKAHNVIGVKFLALNAFHDGHAQGHLGLGLSYERSVIEHLLEVEVSASVLPETAVPIDILLKVPVHVGESIVLFAGIGPLIAIDLKKHDDHDDHDGHDEARAHTAAAASEDHDESRLHFGVASALGAYYWFSKTFGLLAQANLNVVAEDGAVFEAGGVAGLAARF